MTPGRFGGKTYRRNKTSSETDGVPTPRKSFTREKTGGREVS